MHKITIKNPYFVQSPKFTVFCLISWQPVWLALVHCGASGHFSASAGQNGDEIDGHNKTFWELKSATPQKQCGCQTEGQHKLCGRELKMTAFDLSPLHGGWRGCTIICGHFWCQSAIGVCHFLSRHESNAAHWNVYWPKINFELGQGCGVVPKKRKIRKYSSILVSGQFKKTIIFKLNNLNFIL